MSSVYRTMYLPRHNRYNFVTPDYMKKSAHNISATRYCWCAKLIYVPRSTSCTQLPSLFVLKNTMHPGDCRLYVMIVLYANWCGYFSVILSGKSGGRVSASYPGGRWEEPCGQSSQGAGATWEAKVRPTPTPTPTTPQAQTPEPKPQCLEPRAQSPEPQPRLPFKLSCSLLGQESYCIPDHRVHTKFLSLIYMWLEFWTGKHII